MASEASKRKRSSAKSVTRKKKSKSSFSAQREAAARKAEVSEEKSSTPAVSTLLSSEDDVPKEKKQKEKKVKKEKKEKKEKKRSLTPDELEQLKIDRQQLEKDTAEFAATRKRDFESLKKLNQKLKEEELRIYTLRKKYRSLSSLDTFKEELRLREELVKKEEARIEGERRRFQLEREMVKANPVKQSQEGLPEENVLKQRLEELTHEMEQQQGEMMLRDKTTLAKENELEIREKDLVRKERILREKEKQLARLQGILTRLKKNEQEKQIRLGL